MKRLIWLVLIGAAFAQLPDAPAPQPAAKCGPWACYHLQTIPTRQVFQSKAFYALIAGDFMAGAFDAEMTHEGIAHHVCVEGSVHPPYPSRGDLYRAQIPEYAATAAVGFIWLKVRGPKWLMPALLTGPIYGHIFKGGLPWYEGCW